MAGSNLLEAFEACASGIMIVVCIEFNEEVELRKSSCVLGEDEEAGPSKGKMQDFTLH